MADNRSLGLRITANFSSARAELAKFKQQVGNTNINLSDKNIRQVNDSLKEATKTTRGFGSTTLDVIGKVMKWSAVTAVVFGVQQAFKGLGQEIRSIDDDITIMSITTNNTANDFERLLDINEEMAVRLGATNSVVREASKLFSNLNSTVEETASLSESAILLSNVAGLEFSIESASSALFGLQRQFDEFDTDELASNISFISANLAIDFTKGIQELSNSVSVSGKVAQQAGFDVVEYLSLIGKTMESTRTSGAHVAAALKTIISRLQRVQEVGDIEEISKISNAFREAGIEILETEDTFKTIPEVLRATSERWSELTDVQRKNLAFLASGTRRTSEFYAILENYADSVKLANQANENSNFIYEANEKHIESITGRLNILKAEYQSLARDVLTSDLFKEVIDSGTEFVRVLQIIDENFGLLNTVLAVTIPLIIAFKGALILDKVNAIGGFLYNLALGIETVGVSATVATVGITGLKLALGGITAVVSLVAVAFIGLKKQHADFIRDTKDASAELGRYTEQWSKLNEEQKENARLRANETIANLRDAYVKAKEEIEPLNEEIDRLNSALEVENMGNQTDNAENLATALGDLTKEQSELNLVIDAYENALRIADGSLEQYTAGLESLNRKVEEGEKLQRYWNIRLGESDEIVEEATENFDAILEKISELTEEYEFLSDRKQDEAKAFIKAEIEKTEALLQQSRLRANAYVHELQAQQVLTGFFDDAPMDEQLDGLVDVIDQYLFQLNKLQGELNEIDPPTIFEKDDNIDKAKDQLTEQEQAVKDLEASLRLLESQEELATTTEDRNDLRQQQIDVLEDLQDVVGEGTQEWYDYAIAIQSVNQEIEGEYLELQREAERLRKEEISDLEDLNEELEKEAEIIAGDLKDALEEDIKLREEILETEVDSRQEAIDNLDDEINALKEKNRVLDEQAERTKILQNLEQANQELSNVQSERNTATIVDGRRVFIADPEAERRAQEEVSRLTEDLARHDVEVAREAELRKLQDERDALQDSLDSYRETEENKIRASKEALSEISDLTREELEEQTEAWEEWSEDNQDALRDLQAEVQETIRALNDLNERRLENARSIEEIQNPSGSSRDESDFRGQNDQDGGIPDRSNGSLQIREAELPSTTSSTSSVPRSSIDNSNNTIIQIDTVEVRDTSPSTFANDLSNNANAVRRGSPAMNTAMPY